MNNPERYEYDDRNYVREVSLKHLLVRALRRWKIVVIGALVAGLAFGAFSIYRGRKMKEAMNAAYEEYEIALENYNASMEELQSEIASFQDQIAMQQDYLNSSIVNSINPYKEQMASAQLNFTLQDEEGADGDAYKVMLTSSLVRSYGVYILDLMNYAKASEELGIGRSAIREMISVSYADGTNVALVSVRHDDGEVSGKILDYIIEELRDNKPIFEAEFGPHTMTVLHRDVHDNIDKTLANSQATRGDIITALTKSMTSVQTTMNSMEKPAEVTRYSRSWLLRNAMIMGVLGLVLGGFGITLALMLLILARGTLVTGSEISRRFRIRCLADLAGRDTCDSLAAKLENIAARGGYKRFLIISSLKGKELSSLREELAGAAKDGSLSFSVAGKAGSDPDSVRRLRNYDAFIIAEKVGQSRYNDVVRMIEGIPDTGKEAVGLVMLG